MATEDLPQPQICHWCRKPATDDDFCYGCHVYICEDCNDTDASAALPFGGHEPERHLAQGDFRRAG